MPTTPNTGSEAPSHLGGEGWVARQQSHAEELGTVWAGFSARGAVGTLRDVVLGVPGPELDYPEPPGHWLMDARPDREQMARELDLLCAAYADAGVRVHLHRPARARPNHIFCADLFFMTPEGALLARMAAEQRVGEEVAMAAYLAGLGVPILATPRGRATFEGADAIWLDDARVLVGVGNRTNAEGAAWVGAQLAPLEVEVCTCTLSPKTQHLLGAFVPVDHREALVREAAATPSLLAALDGWRLHRLPDDAELVDGRAMNVVTLGPRRVLMPAGAPSTEARFRALGLEVSTTPITQALRAAGGIGCLTGVLRRDSP